MSKKDEESEIMKQMFDEIIKMIKDRHIKLESIIQGTIEHGISQDTFERTYKILQEHGKQKNWL